MDKPRIKQVIESHYSSSQGYISDYITEENYHIAFSEYIDDCEYNHIIHHSGDLINILEATKGIFKERKRVPALYITPLSDFYKKDIELEKLEECGVDSWMELTKENFKHDYPKLSNLEIIEATKEDKDSYIDIFKEVFSYPDDTYGQLPDAYIKSEELFFQTADMSKNKIFIAKEDGKAIACVRFVNNNGIYFSYAFGVKKEYRSGGKVAQALGGKAIESIFSNGAKSIIIQTEANTPLERFYRLMGFNRIFTGTYYKGK